MASGSLSDRDFELLAAARSYLPRWLFERALFGEPVDEPRTVEAAVLLADMAGFTALTRRLALQGNVGSEQTTEHLNAWFTDVLEPVQARGGDVTSFAGDSFAAVFPDASPEARLARAAAAAREIAALGRSARLAIADGTIHELAVGDERARQPVTLGPALRQAAAALGRAGIDEVWAPAGLPGLELEPPSGGFARLAAVEPPPRRVHTGRGFTSPASPAVTPRALAALRPFLPETIWQQLLLPPQLGEHRPVTTLFVRVGDVEDGAGVEPSEVAADLAGATTAAVRSGGYVQKIEAGDKGLVLLALFGAPAALEDAPGRALAAAAACTATGRMAAAVTTGRVFAGDLGGPRRREFTAIGEAVNKASRLLQAAPLGQVWCDPETAWAAPGFTFSAGLALQAKGFERPLEVRVVSGAAAAPARGDDDPLPLVGRAEVLERIRRRMSFEEVGTLTLVGEGGIGKSRLLREAAALCRERSTVVCTGHFGGPRPFAAFAEIAQALGEPAGSDRAALVDAIRTGLRRRSAPVALLFEDLHLAEPDDVALWGDVLAVATAAGAVVLASTRPGGPIPVASTGERVELAPLDEHESVRLLELHAPGLNALRLLALARRGRGNPLFLEALAQHGEGDELPRSIEEAIRVRLDRLEPIERRVLQLAAVCGEAFDRAVLERVGAGLGAEAVQAALRSLTEARLLRADGAQRLRFAHALERKVAYDALPFAQRKELHALALRALEEGGDADAAELFLHLDALGDAPRAAAAACRAAAEAADVHAGHRTVRYARLALERLDDPAERCRAEALLAIGLNVSADRVAAAKLALEAQERAAALGLPELSVQLFRCAAEALSYLADYDASDDAVRRGLEVVAAHGLGAQRGGLVKVLGWNEWGRGNYPEARRLLEEARAATERDTYQGRRIASALGSVLNQLGLYAETEEVIPSLDAIQAAVDAIFLLDHASIAVRRADTERLRVAIRRFEELVDLGEGTRLAFENLARAAMLQLLEGDRARGEANLERARQGHLALGARYEAVVYGLDIRVEQLLAGELATALEGLRAAAADAAAIEARDEEARAEVLGAIAAHLAGEAPAPAVVERAHPMAQRTQRFLLVLELGALQALLAPSGELEELFDRYVALAERRGDRAGVRFLRAVQAQELSRRGLAAAAAACRAELARATRDWGCPGYAPAG